jgi:hypothetical protein
MAKAANTGPRGLGSLCRERCDNVDHAEQNGPPAAGGGKAGWRGPRRADHSSPEDTASCDRLRDRFWQAVAELAASAQCIPVLLPLSSKVCGVLERAGPHPPPRRPGLSLLGFVDALASSINGFACADHISPDVGTAPGDAAHRERPAVLVAASDGARHLPTLGELLEREAAFSPQPFAAPVLVLHGCRISGALMP